MKILLVLKHWQIFIMMVGTVLLTEIFFLDQIISGLESFNVFLAILMFAMACYLLWIWSIAILVSKKYKVGNVQALLWFKVFYVEILSYFTIGILSRFHLPFTDIGFEVMHLPTILFLLFCIFCAARIMRSAEFGSDRLSECFGDFFLLWFYPIGIWIIQPRLNKLMK